MTRIEELRNQIREAKEAYYNLNPILDDKIYDALLNELQQLSPEDFEVVTIGATPLTHSVWEKVKHEIPMGSLSKVNETNEFINWITEIQKKTNETKSEILLITHKLDGSSLEVIYENGKLIRGTSRGDGIQGEDITINVTKIPNLPKTIPITTERIYIRGEVMMLKQIFEEKYSNKYANPRNTAAGKIRDKKNQGEDCSNLIFIAFTLISKTAPNTEADRFLILQKMGFKIPPYFIGNQNQIIEWHEQIRSTRSQIPYEIDGNVIRINDITVQESLGELNMRPRGQIAWKFDPAMGTTIIKDIKWQVGPTGRICPVMIVKPISVGGVTITHISLHNIAMFNKLQLSENDEVLISRRNDVIPYCEANLTKEIYID